MLIRLNIYAERTGCWESYLKSVRLMLPYLAAVDRDKYTKLLRWLLEEFEKIPEDVKSQGGFVVRTSTDNVYGCQYGDYTIETFLMKPFKEVEGLTRGRSLDPLTRMIWINTRPQLGEIDRRVRLMAGLALDSTTSRHLKKTVIDRENRWVNKTVEFFEARCVLNRDSVSQSPEIINIGYGYVALNTVNIHEAYQLGNKILSSMDVIVVEGRFKWNRKDCVTQMPSKPRFVKTSDGKKEARVFDTTLALQWVMINAESIPEAFQYELSDYPTALFSNGQMKDAGKWRFAKHLCNTWGEDSIVAKDTLIDPVLIYDGGMLVPELVSLWIWGKTVGAIADNYLSYHTRITRGTCEIIVAMDGYLGISTKGHMQRKCNPTQILDFVVQNDTVLDVSAIVFLFNPSNKQGFVDILSKKINARSRLTAKKCSGDADRSMVTTALETVELHKPVIL